MGKPYYHARSSVKSFGGQIEDYMPIHTILDSSKIAIADNRHRALTHNTWFIQHILPKIFGDMMTNSDGKKVSVVEIGEQHVLEDFAGLYIPTAQDYLSGLDMNAWYSGQGIPPSVVSMTSDEHTTFYHFNSSSHEQ